MNNKTTDIKKLVLSKIDKIYIANFNNDISSTLDATAKAIGCGCKIVQFNLNNSVSDKTILECAIKLRQLCSIYNALFIIKNRIDIVQLSQADGIIIDSNSVDIAKIKKILSNELYFGYIQSDNEQLPENIDEFDFIQTNNKIITNKIVFKTTKL